jgi:hypothetical protein
MAKCLDTMHTSLMNCEVEAFLVEKRALRKAAGKPGSRRDPYTPPHKEARWVEGKVRSYIYRTTGTGLTIHRAAQAFEVLAGSQSAAAALVAEVEPKDPHGAAAIKACADHAQGWGLSESARLHIVNLRACTEVEVILAVGSSAISFEDSDATMCADAMRAILGPREVGGGSLGGLAEAGSSSSAASGAPEGKAVRFQDE